MMSPALRNSVMVISLVCVTAWTAEAQSVAMEDSCHHKGLFFDLGFSPHFSSPTSYMSGGYVVFIGFGFVIARQFTASIQIYTGGEDIPKGTATSVWGYLNVGGGSLGITLFLSERGRLRPYATVSYALVTLLNDGGLGYNGGGPGVAVGVQAEFSSYLALGVQASYSVIRFHDPVMGPDPAGMFSPFSDRLLSLSTRVSFYPNILP